MFIKMKSTSKKNPELISVRNVFKLSPKYNFLKCDWKLGDKERRIHAGNVITNVFMI